MSKFWLTCLTAIVLFSASNSNAALNAGAYGSEEYLTFDASNKEYEMESQGKTAILPSKANLEGKLCSYLSLSFGLKKSSDEKVGSAKTSTPRFTELVIDKLADGNVSKLSLACLTGTPYKSVNLYSFDINFKPMGKISLLNVFVKSVEYLGEAGDSHARITLTFETAVFEDREGKAITVQGR
jgi:hypothetical protein